MTPRPKRCQDSSVGEKELAAVVEAVEREQESASGSA